MYSYGAPHIAEQKQGDQLEPTYSSSVRIRDVALKTSQKRWTIGKGGKRGSGISVLVAQDDDDDDDDDDDIVSGFFAYLRIILRGLFNAKAILVEHLFNPQLVGVRKID